MAIESRAEATWEGDLRSGRGSVRPASGAFPELEITWRARAEDRSAGTSPEELLGAAHAGCLSMALANSLSKAGHAPTSLRTTARVTFEPGQGIAGIALRVRAEVPGLEAAEFHRLAESAKADCPVSRALAAVPITLEAELASPGTA